MAEAGTLSGAQEVELSQQSGGEPDCGRWHWGAELAAPLQREVGTEVAAIPLWLNRARRIAAPVKVSRRRATGVWIANAEV